MTRFLATAVSFTFYSIFGLLSCSPDKHANDIYGASPPVVKGPDSSLDLKAWDQQAKKELDLQDHLDFSKANPVRITVASDCVLNGEHHQALTTLHSQDAQVWTLLAEDLLVHDLSAQPPLCNFKFNLYNAAGSNHWFDLLSVPIVETRAEPVHVDNESATAGVSAARHLSAFSMPDVRVRYDNHGAASVQLVCRDMELKTLPFDQVMELAHLDLAHPVLRPPATADTLSYRPTQSCRLLLRQSGERVALSDLLQISLPRPPLQVTRTQSPWSEKLTPFAADERLQDVLWGRPVPLAEWQITNPDRTRRYLRLKQAAVGATISAYEDAFNDSKLLKMSYVGPWIKLNVPQDQAKSIQEKDGSTTFWLEGGSSVRIQAHFVAHGILECDPNQYRAAGAELSGMEPIRIDELDENQLLLGQQEIPFGLPVSVPEGNYAAATPTDARCSW